MEYAWNLDKLTSCSSCGTSRYSEYTWTCNTCGAWNLESAISCSSCFAPRYHTGLLDEPVAPIYPGLIEDPVINPLPDSSGWICSTCGTHNGEFEASCTGCGASRQAIGLVDGVIF